MSTHALVGVRTETGYNAKFVHWDGYPDAMLPALGKALVEQDLQYILANHWSSFSSFNHDRGDGHDVDFYTESVDIDAEYLYIIETDADEYYISTYIPVGREWVFADFHNTITRKVASIW